MGTGGAAGRGAGGSDSLGAGGNLEPGDGGAGGVEEQGAGGSPGATETVHYYGRWNLLDDRAITVNSGSHVVTQFSGTGINAIFDVSLNQPPNPTLTWRIDGGEWEEAELAASMPLATDLPPGTHEVLLMVRGLNENQNRWNPPLISSITFVGFEVTGGGTLEPSPRPERLSLADSPGARCGVASGRLRPARPPHRRQRECAHGERRVQLITTCEAKPIGKRDKPTGA